MGDSITEGTLLELAKAVGEHVAMEEIVASIETDKVTVEVRSPAEGTITAFFAKPDDNVLVGADFMEIDVGASGGAVVSPTPVAAAPTASAAPTTSASAAAPPSRRPHPSGRASLITFPSRGELALAAAKAPIPAAAPSTPPPAPPTRPSAAIADELPARFRKRLISEEEMECIDMGGAGFTF